MMTTVDAATGLSAEDRAALQEAVYALEHPGFAARLASVIGRPVERVGRALPPAAADCGGDGQSAQRGHVGRVDDFEADAVEGFTACAHRARGCVRRRGRSVRSRQPPH
jgi:hypothetical protein